MFARCIKRIPVVSWGALLVLLIHLVLVAFSATYHPPTSDEPAHLDAGLDMVRQGYFGKNLGNPPLANVVAAFPVAVLYPDFELQLQYDRRLAVVQSVDICWIFTLARFGCIPFSLLGAYVCYRWSSELHGEVGGLLSLCLWCFFPNILGHAQLITADVASAAASILATYMLWCWWREPCWVNAVFAGLALGMALLAKMVCVVLLVLWPAMWIAIRVSRQYSLPRPTSFLCEARDMSLLLVVAILMLNWGYAFERTMRPLDEYLESMAGVRTAQLPAALRWTPVPLPQNYVRGLWDVRQVVGRSHRSYVAGEWRDRGVWFYYLYGLAVKVPLGAMGLFLIAVVTSLRCRVANDRAGTLFLVIPAAAYLAFVSYSSMAISHHFRYAMPVLPFCFVFAGGSARRHCGGQFKRVAVVTCWVAAVSASLWNYPHSLSYFNVLGGGAAGGRYHMIDSNLDWGQDLLLLKRWVDRNPQARPLYCGYFGRIDPKSAGIEYRLPKSNNGEQFAEGWYAISVNLLMGLEFLVSDGQGGVSVVRRDDYRYFRQLTPVARAGYSIDIYHLEGQGKDDSQLESGP